MTDQEWLQKPLDYIAKKDISAVDKARAPIELTRYGAALQQLGCEYQALAVRARLASLQRRPQQAKQLQQQLLQKLDTNRLEIVQMLAKSLDSARDRISLHRFLQHELPRYPGNTSLRALMMVALAAIGDVPQALAINQQLLQQLERNRATHPNGLGLFSPVSLMVASWRHYQCLQYYDRAEEVMQTLLQHYGDDPEVQFVFAEQCLLLGDYTKGWRLYRSRFNNPAMRLYFRQQSQPLWQGDPLGKRRLVIFHEQGIGDAIQFVRYVRCIAKQQGTIIVEAPASLKRLLATISEIDQIFLYGEAPPEHDVQISLMSLPDALQIPVAPMLPDQPLFQVMKNTRLLNRDGSKKRLALCWRGSPKHSFNGIRSMSLEMLLPLTTLSDWQCYSMQFDATSAELSGCQAHGVIDLTHYCQDYYDTAQWLRQMDLVISVDTSLAHLAGSLAIPVWILLAVYNDWRWQRDSSDSVWYPSATLFRQTKYKDWLGVVHQVLAALSDQKE